MKTILKAVRCQDFEIIGDRPCAVVLDVYDTNGNFIENGTDWSYFATEEQAQEYIRNYNSR